MMMITTEQIKYALQYLNAVFPYGTTFDVKPRINVDLNLEEEVIYFLIIHS